MSRKGYGTNLNELSLPQEHAFQCDMLIWNNAEGLGAQDHPGHAAVVVRRTVSRGPWRIRGDTRTDAMSPLTPAVRPNEFRNVSFWPGMAGKQGLFTTRAGKFQKSHLEDFKSEVGGHARQFLNNGAAARPGQIVVGLYENNDDIWGQMPTSIVPVLGLSSARADRLGLSLNRIVNWAAGFRTGGEFNYVFASKNNNCAGVAVRAMREGGGDAFAKLGGNPAEPTFYMLPNDAELWAHAVRMGVERCNRMLGVLRNRTAFMQAARAQITDLMTAREWKAQSDVAWMVRGRMTAAIDKALRDYHERDWEAGFRKKLDALVTIIRNVHDHLGEASKRDAAYLTLANQIVAVVANLSRKGDEPWTAEDYYGDPSAPEGAPR